jgi:hypothetical protein
MDTPRPDARRDVIPIGDEQLLVGGRITPGVVRIDATVRRPTGPHSPFVHRLLRFLEELDFDGVPRLLGIDEQGRETLSFIEGFVPPDLDATLSDQQLAECPVDGGVLEKRDNIAENAVELAILQKAQVLRVRHHGERLEKRGSIGAVLRF